MNTSNSFGIGWDDEEQPQQSAQPSGQFGLSFDDEDPEDPDVKNASWINWAKEQAHDVAVQSARGIASAMTWPLSVAQAGTHALLNQTVNEREKIASKLGMPFDREGAQYGVDKAMEFFPSWQNAEKGIEWFTGEDLQPKNKAGEVVNKIAQIATVVKGGPGKKLASGVAGAAATQTAKAAGAGDAASEIIGDITPSLPDAIKTVRRILPAGIEELRKQAAKYKLAFQEYMTMEPGGFFDPKIPAKRAEIIKQNLAKSSQEAAKDVIEKRVPISQLRQQGYDLKDVVSDAWDDVRDLAAKNPTKVNTASFVDAINTEISRLRSLAKDPSSDTLHKIKILEKQKNAYLQSPGPATVKGQRIPSGATDEQLINQHIHNNSEMSKLYSHPDYKGREKATEDAYQFLNGQIRDLIEKEGQPGLVNEFRNANTLTHQTKLLEKSEKIYEKAFKDGYNPKILQRELEGKNGKLLAEQLGEDAVKELQEIAHYGSQAHSKLEAFSKSPDALSKITELGPLSAVIYAHKNWGGIALTPVVAATVQRARGLLASRPATRNAYKVVVKDTAKSAIDNLKADFANLNEAIIQEFGSVDAFMELAQEDEEDQFQ